MCDGVLSDLLVQHIQAEQHGIPLLHLLKLSHQVKGNL